MSKDDMRSELAIKRDEWFDSNEGRSCCNYNKIFSFVGGAGYLKNRIEAAFLAGAKANTETQQVVCDELAGKILTGDAKNELYENAKAAYINLTNNADWLDDSGQVLHTADRAIMAAFDEFFG